MSHSPAILSEESGHPSSSNLRTEIRCVRPSFGAECIRRPFQPLAVAAVVGGVPRRPLRRPHRSTSPSSTHPDPHSAASPPPSGCCSARSSSAWRTPLSRHRRRGCAKQPDCLCLAITRRNPRNTRITQYTLILRSRAEVVRTKRGRPGGRAGRGVADIGRAGRLQAHRPGGKCRCTNGSGHHLRTNETAPRAPGCGRRPR